MLRHLSVLICMLVASVTAAFAQATLPPEAFATRPVLTDVALSPDGTYLAFRRAQTRNGDYLIEVRRTNDLSGDPILLGATRMDITGLTWLNDERLRVTFLQQVRNRIEGQNQGVFQAKQAIFNANGQGRPLEMYDDTQLISRLRDYPDEVLVLTSQLNYEDANIDELRRRGASISDATTANYYRMNVNNGNLTLALRGGGRLGGYVTDTAGNFRLASEFDPATRQVIYYHTRDAAAGNWTEFYRTNAESRDETFTIVGFDPANSNMVFVSANRGADTASIWEMDVTTGAFGERVFGYDMMPGLPRQDIKNAWINNDPANGGDIIGFVYYDADGARRIAFIDGDQQALYDQLEATFPGKEVTIVSRSRGSAQMVIRTESATDAGTFYLLDGGRLTLIGTARPTLPEAQLAENMYIEYQARDGRTIPAYITIPDGEGPFPLIVMPHGGPWVDWHPSTFDEWTQLLAEQGYMVLDPSFRGTTGLGQDHWTSSFGEWGGAMSDDMDDGALFLVEQGLVDPDRMAMFGWSFGGYSAFAASIRQPQIYQCAIAGAGVGDPVEFRAFFTRNRLQRSVLEEGYAGLNTVNQTANVSVPILVVHGDLDQRVRIYHSEQFVAGLRRNNKPHRFVVLEGADHFDNTLTFDHRMTLYTEMLDFLNNDCGPGGL